MTMQTLSEEERHVIKHALGLDWRDVPYRNGYKAPQGHYRRHVCVSLCGKGLMFEGSHDTFEVTEEGMRIATARGDQ